MKKSSQITWKIVPLRHFFPLKVVPLIEVLLYTVCPNNAWLLKAACILPIFAIIPEDVD
jgi:hypothetical protein